LASAGKVAALRAGPHLRRNRSDTMPMQSTAAFAPTEEDLAEGYFDPMVITFAPLPAEEDEPEQGEP
jgi:hypothetical protein